MVRITLTLKKLTKQFARYEYNGPEGIVNLYRPLDKLPTPVPDSIEVEV